MMKTITIREAYDWVYIHDIGDKVFFDVLHYIDEKHPKKQIIEQQNNRFRFINYVGVIICAGVRFEIVPKINLSRDKERLSLLSMLRMTNFLPISFYERMTSGEGKSDLLSAFLSTFVERLLLELTKGIHRTYVTEEDNLNVLKGKLDLPKHIQQNVFYPTRVYCHYDEYSENNALNQLLKAALMIVRSDTELHVSRLQLERCLRYLDNVDLLMIDDSHWEKINFNRHLERFKDVAHLAKMIVDHASIYQAGRQAFSYSFLFPMNELFEDYIEVVLLDLLGYGGVLSQHAEKRLLRNKKTGYRNILLKPDFVVGDDLIIDTKWKSATVNERTKYEQADIYQMYAYVTAYSDVKRAILLYPRQESEDDHPLWEDIDTNKTIEMHTVRLDTFEHTYEYIRALVE